MSFFVDFYIFMCINNLSKSGPKNSFNTLRITEHYRMQHNPKEFLDKWILGQNASNPKFSEYRRPLGKLSDADI